MAQHRLARVRWHVGQTLLPEHLVAQEDAIAAEQRLRARLDGLPGWGVVRLAWNEEQLAGGVLAITELTLVLPGGELVDVPGNACVGALDLKALGRPRVTVYGCLRGATRDATGVPLYAGDPPTVARVLRRFELSADLPLDGALASMPIVFLAQDGAHGWQPTAPLPPLLQVGIDNPFQSLLLGRVESLLRVLESRLLLRLGGGQAGPALQQNQTRQLVARVQSLLARLDDLDQGISSHPFVLYRALRELYFDVCVFVEVGAAVPPPYRHDDPSGCFAALTALFDERLGPATRTTEKPFVRQSKPPVFLLPEVPEAARQASEVYLLVRGAGTDPATIESLKLAALGRLPLLHSRVLEGVPIRHLADPPFPHAFAPEVDFYLLGRNAEWQLAVREGTLAFHASPVLETCQVSLFWR